MEEGKWHRIEESRRKELAKKVHIKETFLCVSSDDIRTVVMSRSKLNSLVLLIIGTFLGYQLAFFHLQTEKLAGQVILSRKQFEHMLRNMNSETWNQPRAVNNLLPASGMDEGKAAFDGSVSESSDDDSRRPTYFPPDIGTYLNTSCGERKNTSLWYEERFDEGIKAEWSGANILLSGEAFRWWNWIQPGNESLQHVLKLTQDLVPFTSAEERSESGDTCRRCAVVGNSGNLVNSSYGRFINAHQSVFRINRCPMQGYTDDIGNRTTHHFAYPESFYEEYLEADATLVFTPFKADDLEWLRDYLRSSTGDILRERFHLYNPELMWRITRRWGIGRGIYPSTGLLAVFYALYTCHEVDLFGFGPDREGEWDHYYDKEFREEIPLFKKPVVHDAEAELDLLYKLDSAGKIRIYQGVR